jgi:hypothetical protein
MSRKWRPFKPPTDVELAAQPRLEHLPCMAVVMRELALAGA